MRVTRSRLDLCTMDLLAIGLLIASAIFYASVLRPAEEQLRNVEDTLARRVQASMTPVSSAADETGAKLGAFYAFFEKQLTFTDWLARFYDVGERAGVEVQQAEYRRTGHDDIPMVAYEIVLPVSGDYGKIRSFAEGVLNAIPVASLDQISFKRARSNPANVEAELRFTFYLPAHAPGG